VVNRVGLKDEREMQDKQDACPTGSWVKHLCFTQNAQLQKDKQECLSYKSPDRLAEYGCFNLSHQFKQPM